MGRNTFERTSLSYEEFHQAGQVKLIQEVFEAKVDDFFGQKWYEHDEKYLHNNTLT